MNNFKTIEKPKKNKNFRIKNVKFYRKMLFSYRKNYTFSIEILIFYTKNCVLLRFFYGFEIIHFNFHLPCVKSLKLFFWGGSPVGPVDFHKSAGAGRGSGVLETMDMYFLRRFPRTAQGS